MANKDSARIGALLRQHRAAIGLTQEQLASRAGLSPDTIRALEHGRRYAPRGATVDLLASALRLDGDMRAQFVDAARAGAIVEAHEASCGGQATTACASLATLALLAASQPTSLVDRSEELALIHRLLTEEGARLLTLTGPAGVGKTRRASLPPPAPAGRLCGRGCSPHGPPR